MLVVRFHKATPLCKQDQSGKCGVSDNRVPCVQLTEGFGYSAFAPMIRQPR